MSNFSKVTDEQLVLLFNSSEKEQQAIFLEMVNRFREKVYFHVRRILDSHEDADDAAQLTFIKVWQNLPAFRGDSRFYSWIYRIATNEALNILRKNRKWESIDEDETSEQMLSHAEPSLPQTLVIENRLNEAIEALPKKQQLVFNLRYFEEFSYEDMAEITGTSVGALKASYFHAVKKIEQSLTQTL